MANTLKNTLDKVGNAIETALGSRNKGFEKNPQINNYGQTCLERIGMDARSEQLFRNEWRKDLEYTKLLVEAEYDIQTEFKVSSYEDRITEQIDANAAKAKETAAKQLQAAKTNTEERHEIEDKNAASVLGGVEEDRRIVTKQISK